MSTEVAPLRQFEFHGVYTDDNPIRRPQGTAAKCIDFRVMPGFWLRLRGGRKARAWANDGTVQQIVQFATLARPGNANQMMQLTNFDGTCVWKWFPLNTYTIDPVLSMETISLVYDGGYATANAAAACQLSDRVLFYNGLGVRDGSNSRPALSSFDGTATRFFGLDAYAPSGNPNATFALGAGFNTVATSINIWVGLYHSSTDHYSNAVYAGAITTTGGTGTITVNNLSRLKTAYHNFTEQSELFYVFYATVDGGQVPYLILNSSLDGPLKTAIANASLSLSVANGTTNGWNLDLTKEAPFENFPPRPCRSIAFVNGRLYAALMAGGSGGAVAQPGTDGITRPDFSYVPTVRDQAGVGWSKAAGDDTASDALGDPLQCWPLKNWAPCPSTETPLLVTPALDDVRVLVVTATATFLLEEISDGIHEYKTVSRIHGISEVRTLAVTDYGIVWMTQRNVMVLLRPGSMQLEILSDKYQSLFQGVTCRCADYILDPVNDIDRYQVWLSDGTAVCHDFRIGGEAYTCTNQDYTAAKTVTDLSGNRHHIVAKKGVYTQEAQPDTGNIPSTDDNYQGIAGGGSITAVEVNGEYHRNWDAFDNEDLRKGMHELLTVGDANTSTQLAASPLTLEWYADLVELAVGNKQTVVPKLAEQVQSNVPYLWRFKLIAAYRRWFKFVFKLKGHSTDDASFTTLANTATQGDLVKNFYGCLLLVMFRLHVESEVNRP